MSEAAGPRMRPFDPRLARHASAGRGLLAATIAFGLVTTLLIIAQAGFLAHALASATRGVGMNALRGTLLSIVLIVMARAAVGYASETSAVRAAAMVKSQLRHRLIARALRLGPTWLAGQQPGEITTLTTKGLDSLDTYFGRYLPQVVLACFVPVAVIARIAIADWLSAVLIAVTVPLVPVFAVLVGLHTKARTQRQWLLLARLGGHFLDVVEGLPTLKIFGQSSKQAHTIGEVTEEYRKATMSTLRQAFLSAVVLELAATLATALIAVEIGLRLLAGHIGYEPAMLILLLTPEAFLPLRAAASSYHASMEGAAAAGRAFEILDVPDAAQQNSTTLLTLAGVPDLRQHEVRLTDVTLAYPGRDHPALDRLSLDIVPGETVVVSGDSGAGKSSLLAVLLRFADPTSGVVEVGGRNLMTVPIRSWRQQISWLPQHPYLFTATIHDNIALGRPDADARAVAAAAEMAGAAEFIEQLADGYATTLGERGLQLSAGQRQRLALARALLRDCPLLLLDEPTAHLDAANAAMLRSSLARLGASRTVILVTHDLGWAAGLGRHIAMASGRLTPPSARTTGPVHATGRPGAVAESAHDAVVPT